MVSPMRALLCAAVLVLQAVAVSVAAPTDAEERLPGWLGEVKQSEAIEPVAWRPRAFLWRGFLSPQECDEIRRLAEPRLHDSVVVDPVTFKPVRAKGTRSSSGMFFRAAETATIAAVERRVAAWTMIPVEHQERLQVLRYEKGQRYGDHADFFQQQTLAVDPFGNSQRVATVLMYLQGADEGGETVFPHPSAEWATQEQKEAAGAADLSECARRGPSIRARTGDALLFWSLMLNGTEDVASLHASCEVMRGEKWTATKWVHQTPFKTDSR